MVYTFFFKLLVILSIVLIIVISTKNINEFYTNIKNENLPPSIKIKAELIDKKIELTWTRPDNVYVKEYIIEVYIDDNIKPHYIYPKDLKDKYCKYTLKGFDETKNYKFGVYMVDQNGNKGLIKSFGSLKNLQHLMNNRSGQKKRKVNCNPDGSYTISKNCQNNKYVTSNYTDLSYNKLKSDLSKKKYDIDMKLI